MLSRSACALRMSMERFLERYPAWFWTFTFVESVPDVVAMRAWNGLQKDLQRFVRLRDGMELKGVRVAEANNHAIHFHCLMSPRLWAPMVRRLAVRWGFGMIHVRRADRGSVAYLAGYLTKERIPGLRQWSSFGGFLGVRVSNVVNDSPSASCVRFLMKTQRWSYFKAIAYRDALELTFNPVESLSDSYFRWMERVGNDRIDLTLHQDAPF